MLLFTNIFRQVITISTFTQVLSYLVGLHLGKSFDLFPGNLKHLGLWTTLIHLIPPLESITRTCNLTLISATCVKMVLLNIYQIVDMCRHLEIHMIVIISHMKVRIRSKGSLLKHFPLPVEDEKLCLVFSQCQRLCGIGDYQGHILYGGNQCMYYS